MTFKNKFWENVATIWILILTIVSAFLIIVTFANINEIDAKNDYIKIVLERLDQKQNQIDLLQQKNSDLLLEKQGMLEYMNITETESAKNLNTCQNKLIDTKNELVDTYNQIDVLNNKILNMQIKNMADDAKDFGGMYTDKDGLIRVFTPNLDTANNVEQVCIHENAHYVYFDKLTGIQINEYKELFNITDAVTDYAKTEVKEDFAESIMTARVCTWDFNLIPKDRADWIKENVFPLYN